MFWWTIIITHRWKHFPDSKVHRAHMGPIWSRQDPGGPHDGPMNFASWVSLLITSMVVPWRFNKILTEITISWYTKINVTTNMEIPLCQVPSCKLKPRSFFQIHCPSSWEYWCVSYPQIYWLSNWQLTLRWDSYSMKWNWWHLFIFFNSNIFIQGGPFSQTVLPWCPVT